MMDQMANHGNRIRRHMDRLGVEEVEKFIDACLSIEDLIDIHSPFIKRHDDSATNTTSPDRRRGEEPPAGRFQPRATWNVRQSAARCWRPKPAARRKSGSSRTKQFPAEPVRDVMLFLLEHAPLKPWQADVLSIIRDEAYYFAPQGQTKIMNEGWASYWHSTIMTRQGSSPPK